MVQVFIEAFIVGVLLVILTSIFYYILPKNFSMWLAVFLVGFVFHLLCEITGINRYYVSLYCKK